MLNIRCYFTLCKALALLYVNIHQRYLVSGLELEGDLSIEDSSTDAAKNLQAK